MSSKKRVYLALSQPFTVGNMTHRAVTVTRLSSHRAMVSLAVVRFPKGERGLFPYTDELLVSKLIEFGFNSKGGSPKDVFSALSHYLRSLNENEGLEYKVYKPIHPQGDIDSLHRNVLLVNALVSGNRYNSSYADAVFNADWLSPEMDKKSEQLVEMTISTIGYLFNLANRHGYEDNARMDFLMGIIGSETGELHQSLLREIKALNAHVVDDVSGLISRGEN